jgi:hypothetical protein
MQSVGGLAELKDLRIPLRTIPSLACATQSNKNIDKKRMVKLLFEKCIIVGSFVLTSGGLQKKKMEIGVSQRSALFERGQGIQVPGEIATSTTESW